MVMNHYQGDFAIKTQEKDYQGISH